MPPSSMAGLLSLAGHHPATSVVYSLAGGANPAAAAAAAASAAAAGGNLHSLMGAAAAAAGRPGEPRDEKASVSSAVEDRYGT